MKNNSIRKRIIVTTSICFILFWAMASLWVIWIQWQSQNKIYGEQIQYLKNLTLGLLRQQDYHATPVPEEQQGKYFLLAFKNNGLIYKYNFEILGIHERSLIDAKWYQSLRGWIIYHIPINEVSHMILGIKRDDVYGEVFRISLMIASVFIFSGVAVIAGILWSVRSGLRPVKALQSEISARTQDDLGPLDDANAPKELHSFIMSMNNLMRRIANARQMEKRFLDQAAHELKTPLSGIAGQLEVLELESLSEGGAKRVAQIRQLVRRANGLIGQLLDHAQNQHTDVGFTQISLNELAEKEVAQCRQLFPSAHITITNMLEEKTRLVPEVPARLILSNLLNNACLYAQEPAHVLVRLGQQKGSVVCRIADNGAGLSKEAFDLASNPFERLARASGNGTGLGLTIVRETAQKQGWSVDWIEPDTDYPGLTVEIIFGINL